MITDQWTKTYDVHIWKETESLLKEDLQSEVQQYLCKPFHSTQHSFFTSDSFFL
jgi:hypothetical protein